MTAQEGNRRMRAIFNAFVLLASLAPAAALAERPYVAIEQRLTGEQMQATGLDQLNQAQLSLLNQLLREEQANVAIESAAAERVRKKREADTAVSSTLKGEFRGWQDGTVFELENGQRWRVVEGEYHTGTRLANPKVTVNPGLFGSWYIRIEGVGVGAKVKLVEQ